MPIASWLKSLRAQWRALDPALYVLWSAVATIASARRFYGYMMKQTGGEWSAPLDDVFIHFDYARSIAQGHPFEWTPGNGFSSGNTSLTYPFVLAPGWLVGLRDTDLMLWAALVAMACTFGLLVACRPLFLRVRGGGDAMRAGSYFLPLFVLGIGALDWSLWSGMEVAFFLGVWAVVLRAFFRLDDATPREVSGAAWALGGWGALLVCTRPESATSVAAFGLIAALWHPRRIGAWGKLAMLVRVGLPAGVALALQALVNRELTGETSANGAIVKLAINSPFLTADEKLADYLFNLKYTVLRNVEYHFSDMVGVGFVVPFLALAAVAVKETRRTAVLLLAHVIGWLGLVALNGQVRWQNERYTMPAVAWLLILAALGSVALVRRAGRPNAALGVLVGTAAAQAIAIALRPQGQMPEIRLAWSLAILAGVGFAVVLRFWPTRALAVIVGVGMFYVHQESKLRDQTWFFGRACKNIRDQHVVAGRWLKTQKPHRILVGDAGALIYASERPGLDIIGLGGYGGLPFARAGLHGLPATVELIERMSPKERPDLFAIYPSWWGNFPVWFAGDVIARFPAEGNVICGGYEDVVYRANWSVLGSGEAPRAADPARVRDAVDVADLVSEKEHGYTFPTPAGGWTMMKILADPADAYQDLFDGGRRIAFSRQETMTLGHLVPSLPAKLVLRSAPDAKARVHVVIDGKEIDALDFAPKEGWEERVVDVPGESVRATIRLELRNDGPGDFVDYHVWVAQ